MPISGPFQASSIFTKSYNSFSGVDIKAVFGPVVLAEIQALSYSITREKAPIYTMGSADVRSYSRGKRGIAGTVIFIMFDRHALLDAMRNTVFSSDVDDLRPGYSGSTSGRTPADTVENQEPTPVDANSPGADQELAHPWYVDQIPPFDITLAAANEYGALAVMQIFGCEILNEGYGISVDDIVSEQQYTYVARSILPWTPKPNDAIRNAIATGSSS
jgi:hypothetical protein